MAQDRSFVRKQGNAALCEVARYPNQFPRKTQRPQRVSLKAGVYRRPDARGSICRPAETRVQRRQQPMLFPETQQKPPIEW